MRCDTSSLRCQTHQISRSSHCNLANKSEQTRNKTKPKPCAASKFAVTLCILGVARTGQANQISSSWDSSTFLLFQFFSLRFLQFLAAFSLQLTRYCTVRKQNRYYNWPHTNAVQRILSEGLYLSLTKMLRYKRNQHKEPRGHVKDVNQHERGKLPV